MERVLASRRRYLFAAVTIVVVAAATVSVYAVRRASAGPPRQPSQFEFEYAAKFVCANEVGPRSTAFQVGNYRTAVNVHNPDRQAPTMFLKKAVVANSEDIVPRGKISKLVPVDLQPDEAVEIDCRDIRDVLLGGPQPIGDGFVVIYSSRPLDVWAVYTVNREVMTPQGGEGVGESIDVEPVPCSGGFGQCPLR